MNKLIDEHVDESELEDFAGGGSGKDCSGFNCTVNFADEDDKEKVVF